MGITIQTQIKKNYLLINCQGVFTKDDLLKAVKESLKVAIQETRKKNSFRCKAFVG